MDTLNATAFDQVCKIIHQVSGVAYSQIAPGDSLIVTLGLDSVELIDLFMQLETLGVFMDAAHITAALTVGEVAACVVETKMIAD